MPGKIIKNKIKYDNKTVIGLLYECMKWWPIQVSDRKHKKHIDM